MLLERKMDGMFIESVSVDEPFRNPKLVTKSAVQLINELELKNCKLSDIVNSFITLRDDLGYCTFEANTEWRTSSNEIGHLTLKKEPKGLLDDFEHYRERVMNKVLNKHYDDDDDYNGERYGLRSSKLDDLDYTACDKDDCGYCGRCPY